MKVMPVIGVRPQIIKAAPLIKIMDNDQETDLLLIHSGQHYDYEMSKIFFNELNLPDPIQNLNVKSGSHSEQTAKIMLRLDKLLLKFKPDVIIVFGDANTTLGAALAAIKSKIAVAHVEAGLRSWDMRMPEEINRVLTDHISQALYPPTEYAMSQLKKESIIDDLITLSGDTMYDSILAHKEDIAKSNILNNLDLDRENYIVVTVHRAENVDNRERLKNIIDALVEISKYNKIILPIHPRTMDRIKKFNYLSILDSDKNVKLIRPIGYFDMLRLIEEAVAVITDSGGIQKEAFILGTPCITLRERTEWIETIRLGGNTLVGASKESIINKTLYLIKNFKKIKKHLCNIKNPYGDGNATSIIVEDLKNRYEEGKLKVELLPSSIREFLL